MTMLDTTRLARYFPTFSFSFEHYIRVRLQRLHLYGQFTFVSLQQMPHYPLTSTEVPASFAEPFIFRGYRSFHQPWSYYCRSFLHKHNESVNVWSHILGILYMAHLFFYYNRRFDFYGNAHAWPFAVSLCTSMIMFASSAFAHLLHSKSEPIHKICFLIDYMGVSLHGFGSGFLHIYYSSPPWYYDLVQYQYIFVLLVLSILTCFSSCFALFYFSSPSQPLNRMCQFFPCGILWIYSVAPLLIRLFPFVGIASDSILMCHLGQIVFFLVGAFLFAFDLPQRLWPGALDFIGQGHHLFHLCIYMVTVCQMHGVYWDYGMNRSIIDQRSKPQLIFCAGSMFALITWNCVIVCFFRRWILRTYHPHSH